MAKLQLRPIGAIEVRKGVMRIALERAYVPALAGLEGFRHIQVLWWFSECDNDEARYRLTEHRPYKSGPEALGTFVTRSPMRPNPIALDCVEVTHIDYENGIISLSYIEAFGGSPVLDIKPYTPGLDRVERPTVPDWCGHWPGSYEASSAFDWEKEMNP